MERDSLFNLRAVVRQTGVSASTLRAWERRYGLPVPARSSTGRRLYSWRDVDMIRWLVARRAEGMGIGRAVALWRELEQGGHDPLAVFPLPRVEALRADVSLTGLRQEWVAAVLAFNELAAESAMTRAFTVYPPEIACLEVLLGGMREIGNRWYVGQATVHQEHFASALAMRRVEALMQIAPPPVRPVRLLVICPPLESHCFNLLLLAYLLRRCGWEVVYLGADVPLERMEETLRALQPRWVITAAQYLPTVAGLLDLARFLDGRGVSLGYGGRAFNQVPALRQRIPGHFLGERLEDVPHQLERWLAEPAPAPQAEPAPDPYRQALGVFREHEVVIRGTVWLALAREGDAHEWLIDVGRDFGLHLRAALATGEMGLMDAYLSWLRGLRGEGALPEGWLPRYLSHYADAVDRWLGAFAVFLVDYLKDRAGEAL